MSSLNAWAQRFSVIRDQIRCLIIVWFFSNPACKCFPHFSLVCIVWLLISSFLKLFHSKSPRFRRLITNHHFYVRVILCFGFYVAFTDLWPFVGRALLTLSVFHVCALVKLHVWGQHPALLGISRLYLIDLRLPGRNIQLSTASLSFKNFSSWNFLLLENNTVSTQTLI